MTVMLPLPILPALCFSRPFSCLYSLSLSLALFSSHPFSSASASMPSFTSSSIFNALPPPHPAGHLPASTAPHPRTTTPLPPPSPGVVPRVPLEDEPFELDVEEPVESQAEPPSPKPSSSSPLAQILPFLKKVTLEPPMLLPPSPPHSPRYNATPLSNSFAAILPQSEPDHC